MNGESDYREQQKTQVTGAHPGLSWSAASAVAVNDESGDQCSRTRPLYEGQSAGVRTHSELSAFWQGLVDGELHVVNAFFLEQRCYAIAATCVRSPLTEREQTLLRRGFLAEPQKVLAADLGVSGTTVSVLIGRALRKLGLERRMGSAPLAVVLSALHNFGAASLRDVKVDTFEADGRHYVAISVPELDPSVLHELTDAERSVALLLVAGLNQHDIASERGTSPSTIANQIAAISRKLGIGGRFALIRRWAELQWADTHRHPPAPVEVAALPVPRFLAPGDRLAERFEVMSVQGQGGMGVVYRCRDLRTEERVAVKRVIPPPGQAEECLHWFVAEAQALAGVDHEHVVRAREFGQLRDGTAYLAMDLVEGATLEDIAARPLPIPLIWTVVDQVLSALVHTHARGVVHGDLKPRNVMVTTHPSGGPHAHLFDFGLAKQRNHRLDPRLGQRPVSAQPPLRAGTPGYMAPEQILGKSDEISGATDLYALGCVIYCLLSGAAPCTGASARELQSYCFAPPPRPSAPPGTPAELIDFVMRLLDRRPRARALSTAAAREEWQLFRPALGDVPVLWADALERLASARASSSGAASASVARDGLSREGRPPESPPPPSGALARSTAWLPGLLGVRPSPFVGRVQLRRTLASACDQIASSPSPSQDAILLAGPRGIGKSRLAEWLCTDVEERGVGLALRGAHRPGVDSEASVQDALAVALAQHIGSDGSLAALRSALAERCYCSADDLAAAAAWIHHSDSEGTPAPSLPPEAIHRLVHQLAGRHPILLWIDDLTHLRSESIDFMAALPKREPALRVLIVATLRPDSAISPAGARAVQALRDGLRASTLQVGPLDTLTTAALVSAALPVDPSLALKLALQSAGNPLDALERLHALAGHGRAT
jgi:serine/threonine protein kinase/DNA-binding NarL/FixJ family response regulator